MYSGIQRSPDKLLLICSCQRWGPVALQLSTLGPCGLAQGFFLSLDLPALVSALASMLLALAVDFAVAFAAADTAAAGGGDKGFTIALAFRGSVENMTFFLTAQVMLC